MTLIIVINYNSILTTSIQSNSLNINNNLENNNHDHNNVPNKWKKEYIIDNNNNYNDDINNINNLKPNNNNNNNNNLKNLNDNLSIGNIKKKSLDSEDEKKRNFIRDEKKVNQIKTKDKLLYEFLLDAKKLDIQLEIEKTNENWFEQVRMEFKNENSTCHYSNHRNYKKKPIQIVRSLTPQNDNVKCDIPCKVVSGVTDGYLDASVYSRGEQCTKSIFETLENVEINDKYDIVSTTKLTSDVVLGYYAWHEYPYFKKPKAKIHNKDQGLVAAFISNCSPEFRLNYLDKLIEYGVKVDSYGTCRHNKDQPDKGNLDYNGAKLKITESYKFVMAFENSETDDYITEKFFGVLACGSVPIYHGAPNGKKFFPRPNAAIFVNDFESPKKLAEHLLFLDKHDEEYQKFFEYKTIGPTKEWMSIIDNSLVNDDCRTCIKVADLHRNSVGMVHHPSFFSKIKSNNRLHQDQLNLQLVPNSFSPNDGIVIYIREKGKFWFTSVAIPYHSSFLNLIEIISNSLPHKGEIYKAYDLSNKNTIISNDELKNNQKIHLYQNQEIEVIFVDLNFFFNSKKLNQNE